MSMQRETFNLRLMAILKATKPKAQDTSDTDDFYYIIPKEVWGSKLKLEGYSAIGNSSTSFRAGSDAYQYVYEINNDVVGGAGSAFIDEAGNIITDKNLDIQTNTISVNVYMKVSGQNGFYDVASTRLKLGSFRMFLNAQSTSATDITIPESRYGTLTSSTFGSGAISVPNGYSLATYGSSGSLTAITTKPFGDAKQTIACEVGTTLNIAELFAEEAKGKHNLIYHVVADTVNEVPDIIHYNNLNTYKIESEGTHTLTIVVGYRTSNADPMSYGYVELDVMAYNVLNRKDNVIMLYASEYKKTTDTSVEAGKDYFTLTEGGDYVKVESPVASDLGKYYDIDGSTYELGTGPWYAFDEDGSVRLITVSNKAYYTAPVQTGIYTESFVSLDEGVTKVNSFTFYVVSRDDSEERKVVLNQNAPYNLANLFETNGYRFYKVNGSFTNGSDHTASSDSIVEISTENFSIGANTAVDVHYIARSPEGKYFQLTVHYKFTTSSSPTSTTLFVKQGEKLADVVSNQVKADLKNDTANIVSIELIGKHGLLSNDSQIAGKDAEGNDTTDIKVDSKDYVIVYTVVENGKTVTRYVRYSVAFYVYKDSSELTIEAEPTTSYLLNLAGADILKKLSLPENASVTFRQLNEAGRLDPVPDISLATLDSADVKETYVVVIDYRTSDEVEHSDYYLIDLTFTLAASV